METTFGTIPIYISADQFYLYSVLVPEEHLQAKDYVEDIKGWNFMVSHGWGYGCSYEGGEAKKQLFPPLDDTGSYILDNGEPILFYRHFYGFEEGQEVYFELNQRIAHVLDVHWVERRSAYCKLDALGDLKNVVEVSISERGYLATMDFDELELYMFLTDTALIRVFDVTRYRDNPWFEDQGSKDQISLEGESELHAHRVIVANDRSYLRGFQVIRRQTPDETITQVVHGRARRPKQYASFIALDWKHGVVAECSCAPDDLGNYFVESDLPFQISPAFFRPEVILKYKQDPDKYTVEERTITCRGTWSVRYDINKAGQVHVYLRDLGNLPYEEQLYWKSFNEEPKAGISERAYKTDFLAEWYGEYDPLHSLKRVLSQFPLALQFGIERPIWSAPEGRNPFSRLAYVVTDSKKEWEDQILELSRVTIDRLSKKNIRKVAKALGCDDPSLGSLKLLRLCLASLEVAQEVIEEVVGPLEMLWHLRSSGIAHFGDSVPDVDLGKHYAGLLASIDNSMRMLAEFVEQHYFDISKDGRSQRVANAKDG
ncbi:MAG TPA: hypothetical protein ENI39_02035 [Anaerolineae bacterium]|nr:hypothetical protein [Anaerolineae bacterium]